MTQSLTIRLETHHALRLEALADQLERPADVLARDWLVERLMTFPDLAPVQGTDAAIERPIPIDSPAERLRAHYRPDDVVFLLVGESAPAGGTFFYQANSHLFDATREAFENGLGPMPEGKAFLDKFKELGFWLYDMVSEPVNRRAGRPRRSAVSEGVGRLAELITDLDPDMVIGVKTSLEGPIRAAAAVAKFPAGRILILPFPLYQWRQEYVRELSRFMSGSDAKGEARERNAKNVQAAKTLHEAMADVLRAAGGGPLAGRQIANEIAIQGLYRRQDGGRADYQQVLLRAKKYPALFLVSPAGVSLRAPE